MEKNSDACHSIKAFYEFEEFYHDEEKREQVILDIFKYFEVQEPKKCNTSKL